MLPGLPTQLQGVFVAGVTSLFCMPLIGTLIGQQNELRQKAVFNAEVTARNTENLVRASSETEQDLQIGLQRAKNCLVIDPKTPIGDDGAKVRYRGTKIFLPIGTAVCDSHGFTAVQGAVSLEDIRPIDSTTLSQALGARK
jgi:hypothetical protein